MTSENLRILVFGAHPDDCDQAAGGAAALWTGRGHSVQFVSVTNGDAGHQTMAGAALARLRREEAQAAGRVLGVDYRVLDNHDGELLPSLENRRQIINIIREQRPHLVLGPRPNDYHPDHRYTAVLVQDAAYMVTVPNVCAFGDHLEQNPVIMYTSDRFQKPYPFQANVMVDIDSVVDRKLEALACHASQFYEWLPYNSGRLDEVPKDPDARVQWLNQSLWPRMRRDAERFRPVLVRRYGHKRGAAVGCAEAFELCEYGAGLDEETEKKLFPF